MLEPSDITDKHPLADQPVRFGKYELLELLGRGGMAEAWRARITGPAGFERTLVVKRIRGELSRDPQFVELFLREARLSARLHHVNIVQVNELGECEGEYFLAMEFVGGCDLATAVRKLSPGGPLPPAFGAYIVREVARALAFAHGLADDEGKPLRIVHRDVSPSNVMLGFDGGVKLLDFGLAKALAQGRGSGTAVGRLKGKFGYMAPEQFDGRTIDHRVDLFAAGVVLHELLTGRHLFQRGDPEATIEAVRHAEVPPPSTVNPEVPPELDAICARALARKRSERYPSADELQHDLDEVVHRTRWGQLQLGELVRSLGDATAPRLPTLNHTQPSAARTARYLPWRRVAIAAALVLALGIGGGLLSSRWRGPRVEETPRAEARPPPAAPPAAPPSQVREKPPAPAAPPVVEEPPAPPPPVAHAAHVAVEQAPRPRDERTPVGRPAKPKRSKLRDIEHGATLNPF